jgi:hypothetical protein
MFLLHVCPSTSSTPWLPSHLPNPPPAEPTTPTLILPTHHPRNSLQRRVFGHTFNIAAILLFDASNTVLSHVNAAQEIQEKGEIAYSQEILHRVAAHGLAQPGRERRCG